MTFWTAYSDVQGYWPISCVWLDQTYFSQYLILCRRRPQYGSIDVCQRWFTRMVCQIFRSRSDWTMQAFGENGYVQTSEGGNSVGFGPVMVHNFLVNFSVTDNLRPFLEDISDEEFEEILVHLHDIHGTEGKKIIRFDRLAGYTSMRYIVRDMCQMRQRTLRTRHNLQTRLKLVFLFVLFDHCLK